MKSIYLQVKPYLGMIKRFLYSLLPDSIFYQVKYFTTHGSLCNFNKPQKFSEKIHHRMRYPKEIFSVLADRVEVRNFIAERIGSKYLVPMIITYENSQDFDIDELPKSFVMKANDSAGQVKVVEDKNLENPRELRALAKKWLHSDFSKNNREKHYSNIKSKIIVEEALLDNGNSPDDYKVNVFNNFENGEVYMFIQHMQSRKDALVQNLYTVDWVEEEFHRAGEPRAEKSSPKPEFLKEMLEVSKKLSSGFGYMRVDFYIHENKVFIGELTLTPAAGKYKFTPSNWDDVLGSRFGWPEKI